MKHCNKIEEIAGLESSTTIATAGSASMITTIHECLRCGTHVTIVMSGGAASVSDAAVMAPIASAVVD